MWDFFGVLAIDFFGKVWYNKTIGKGKENPKHQKGFIMTVYVIKNTEGDTLEICSSVNAAFTWLHTELQVEGDFKVEHLNNHLVVEAEDESFVILEWMVFDQT